MTESEIAALYWKRPEEAIACTIQKYGRYLLQLAQNILHIREDAEECVNETYLSAWNQLPPDRPETRAVFAASFQTFLSACALASS